MCLGYTAPLYDTVYAKLADNDVLKEWMMKQEKNILFFAGTAMHKEIKGNPMDEKIYNTLVIFGWDSKNRKFSMRIWNKIHYSDIDGFNLSNAGKLGPSLPVRLKDPKNSEKLSGMTDKPLLTFDGIVYSYDICLDYIAMNNRSSVSKKLLKDQRADFNILIAGGMSIRDSSNSFDTIDRKSSDRVVRCDKVRFKDYEYVNPNCNEECCNFRVGETVQDMKVIGGTKIRYVDFEVDAKNNQKTIKEAIIKK